jgi:hypothetical protein
MRAEIAALCAQTRRGTEPIYGGLLRENILEVVACSFPEFTRRTGEERLKAIVNGFVAGHPAHLPQFHHIATEFVLFAQCGGVPASLLPILEYEWMLLDVEIAPDRVRPSTISPPGETCLRLNPTLRLVMLPFDITQPGWPALGDGDQAQPHAVWRNGTHGVVTRVLGHSDCLLIDRLRQSAKLSHDMLAQASALT